MLIPGKVFTCLYLRLISDARKLEVFGYLTVFEACSYLFFELPQLFLHSRINISAVIIKNEVLSPIYRSNNESIFIKRFL